MINNFSEGGISIESTANLVQSSYIGTNAGGTAAGSLTMMAGISMTGANNTIGGLTATPGTGAGNVISGNATGINATGGGGDLIAGNLIGTDVTGENALANTGDGIYLSDTSGNTIGGSTVAGRNVIAADGLRGIEFDSANSNLVENNYIGTDITGSNAMGVGHNGIFDDAVSNSFIDNVIDSSGNIGIVIRRQFDAGSRQSDRLERRGNGRTRERGRGHYVSARATTRSAAHVGRRATSSRVDRRKWCQWHHRQLRHRQPD